MGLPNPKEIRQRLQETLRLEREKERRAAQEALRFEREKERRTKEASVKRKLIKEQTARDIADLLNAAVSRSADAHLWLRLNKKPNITVKKHFEMLGFYVCTIDEERHDRQSSYEKVKLEYLKAIRHIRDELAVWIRVRMHKDFRYEKIEKSVLENIFEGVALDVNDHFDWNSIINVLTGWSTISGGAYGAIEIAMLARNDENFYQLNALLNGCRFNVAIVTKLEGLSKAALEIALRAKVYRKQLAKLPVIENHVFDDEDYEGIEDNDCAVDRIIKATDYFVFWDSFEKPWPKTRNNINAWLLDWLAKASGQEFLEEFRGALMRAADSGIRKVKLAQPKVQRQSDYSPAPSELINFFQIAGFRSEYKDEVFEIYL